MKILDFVFNYRIEEGSLFPIMDDVNWFSYLLILQWNKADVFTFKFWEGEDLDTPWLNYYGEKLILDQDESTLYRGKVQHGLRQHIIDATQGHSRLPWYGFSLSREGRKILSIEQYGVKCLLLLDDDKEILGVENWAKDEETIRRIEIYEGKDIKRNLDL